MWTDEDLTDIFDQGDGHCHLCGARLSFSQYGDAWEVDHDTPRAQGGTDDLDNLMPACVSCNRSKQDLSSEEFREEIGTELVEEEMDDAGDSRVELLRSKAALYSARAHLAEARTNAKLARLMSKIQLERLRATSGHRSLLDRLRGY